MQIPERPGPGGAVPADQHPRGVCRSHGSAQRGAGAVLIEQGSRRG